MIGYCKRSFSNLPGLACALLLIVALLTGCGGDQPQPELAVGQGPFLRHCASCHGINGEGRPPTFPPLAGSEWRELPSEALALVVLLGLRGEIEVAGRTYRGFMPPMQHINDADIADLIGFIEREWSGREPRLDASDIARIRGSFDGRRPVLYRKQGLLEALTDLEALAELQ